MDVPDGSWNSESTSGNVADLVPCEGPVSKTVEAKTGGEEDQQCAGD